MMSKLDEFGGEGSYGHFAVGWAWAMNSPYQWTKQVASHWGGTRNGTIVHWPNGHQGKGRHAQPVQPRHRPRADGARSRRHSRADDGQRRAAEPVRGHQHALQLQRRQGAGAARDAVLRDVLQPRHLPQGLERGDQAPHAVGDGRRRRCRRSTTTSGSSTTAARTGRRPTTCRRRCPRSCTSCSGCG